MCLGINCPAFLPGVREVLRQLFSPCCKMVGFLVARKHNRWLWYEYNDNGLLLGRSSLQIIHSGVSGLKEVVLTPYFLYKIQAQRGRDLSGVIGQVSVRSGWWPLGKSQLRGHTLWLAALLETDAHSKGPHLSPGWTSIHPRLSRAPHPGYGSIWMIPVGSAF